MVGLGQKVETESFAGVILAGQYEGLPEGGRDAKLYDERNPANNSSRFIQAIVELPLFPRKNLS